MSNIREQFLMILSDLIKTTLLCEKSLRISLKTKSEKSLIQNHIIIPAGGEKQTGKYKKLFEVTLRMMEIDPSDFLTLFLECTEYNFFKIVFSSKNKFNPSILQFIRKKTCKFKLIQKQETSVLPYLK